MLVTSPGGGASFRSRIQIALVSKKGLLAFSDARLFPLHPG
jgi:hypothetical protein